MNYETPLGTENSERLPEDAIASGRFGRALAFAKRRPILILAVAAVIGLALYFLLHSSGKNDPFASPDDAQLPVVSVIAPGAGTVTGRINATGTLAARREMPVGSVGEGGRVVSVPVEPGDWVRQGQVLAVIDRSVQNQQIAAQAAQIEVAQADAALAQANLDRGLKLVERGFISRADIDRLTATRDAAVARVNVARAQLGEQRARTARLNIVAPASGLLLTRNVEPGQVVTGGTAVLFSIAKGGEMELLAKVSEDELAMLSTGVAAEVVPAGTQKGFQGQIWQIAPVIDEQTRQGTVRIALSYAPELRPGGFATATISSGMIAVPVLPESAINSDQKGSYVYVLGKDDAVVRRQVRTGFVTDQGIAITEGLTGNEKVVLRAGAFLAAGDKIRPRLVKSALR